MINDNFNEFNGGQQMNNNMASDDWRLRSSEVRQTLLNKLKEALMSQNYPNAQSVAETYENDAFTTASGLKEYQYKLVQWLASIYDSSSAAPGGNPDLAEVANMTASPPDSSTNGLSDVTSSNDPKVHDSEDQAPTQSKDPVGDLLLATPKSEGCLSPVSPKSDSPANTTASSGSTTVVSTASPANTTTSNSITFQCPNPISDPEKLNSTSTASPGVKSTTGQQRRISGSGTNVTAPVVSMNNNPQSVDSGIGLGSPRSITSASSTTLYSPKIQGTSPSLMPGSDNSPEKASSS